MTPTRQRQPDSRRNRARSKLRRRWPSALSRSETALCAAACALTLLLTPAPARAACSPIDIGACTDAAVYSLIYGVAGLLWWIHRALLTVAYQLDNLRWWLVATVFASVYRALSAIVAPALAPIATIAIMAGILAFLVSPFFGRLEVVNIRRAFTWLLIAPLLLAVSGSWLAESERIRAGVAGTLFQAVSEVGPGDDGMLATLFGVRANDMTEPRPLYSPPVTTCGTPLERRGVTGIQLDDMAASLLYANAQDIHCPEISGPSDDLPDGFFATPTPNFAYAGSIDDISDPGLRQERIRGIQRGFARLAVGLLPSILALIAKLIDLVFTVALMLLWLGLPIGLLFVFFLDTAGGVTRLFRRLVGVFQASWTTSLLLGILFAALQATATLGNAAAYAGLSVAGIFLCVYVLKLAVDVLLSSFAALSQTVAMASGASDRLLQSAVVGTAAGLATGGVGAGAAALFSARNYGVARREGASRRYALGTALGRSRLLSGASELAASLGYETDLTDGLYAGRRSRIASDRWRVLQAQVAGDAKQIYGDDDLPMGERTRREQIARQLASAQRGSVVNQALHTMRRATEVGVHTSATTAKATMSAGRALRDDPIGATRSAVQAVAEGGQILIRRSRSVAERRARRMATPVRERVRTRSGPFPTARATIQALAAGMRPELATARLRYDGGRLRIRPRFAPDKVPADAASAPREELEPLLLKGKTIQLADDGSLLYWDRQWRRAIRTRNTAPPDTEASHGSDTSNQPPSRPPQPRACAGDARVPSRRGRRPWTQRRGRGYGPTGRSRSAPRRGVSTGGRQRRRQ